MTYFFISQDGTPTKLEHCVITEGQRERRVVHTMDGAHHIEGPKHPDTFELLLPPGIKQIGDFRITDETGTVFGARGEDTQISGTQLLITGHITGTWEPDDRAKAQKQLRRVMAGLKPTEDEDE